MKTLTIKPKTKEQLIALKAFLKATKIDYKVESNYNKKFVEKILQGREDIKNGKGIPMNVKKLWI